MGNTNTRSTSVRLNSRARRSASTQGQPSTSQFSLSNFVGNLSGRSFLSVTSNQSVYSASRPWSRISRRRWNESTLNNPLEASKTAWPVLHIEAIFLPEYPVSGELGNRDYKVLETIAKGAFGHVYKAENIKSGKKYALKVLSKSQVVSENAVRQVKEEVHIQTVCGHHPFVVGSVAHWQSRKELYIVTEYVSGGELLKLIERCDTLPDDLVQLYVAELALALDFLHNAGVIYRDLKPENILLDDSGHLQLIDFGLSKWLKIGERTHTLCGTYNYMASDIVQYVKNFQIQCA